MRGAPVEDVSNRGSTALFLAAGNGETKAVVQLLRARAMVHTRARDGRTPLMAASAGGYGEIVEALLSAAQQQAVPRSGVDGGAAAVDLLGQDALMSAALSVEGLS